MLVRSKFTSYLIVLDLCLFILLGLCVSKAKLVIHAIDRDHVSFSSIESYVSRTVVSTKLWTVLIKLRGLVISFTDKLVVRSFVCCNVFPISQRKRTEFYYYSKYPNTLLRAIVNLLLPYSQLGDYRIVNSRIHSQAQSPYESYSPTARSRSSQSRVDIVQLCSVAWEKPPFHFLPTRAHNINVVIAVGLLEIL